MAGSEADFQQTAEYQARARRLRDWGLLLSCNLMWASQFAMVKLVQEEMGPLFAVTFPMAISTVLLLPLVKRKWPASHLGGFILLGVAGQVVAQLFITWGVRLSLASNAALISLALPVSTAVMAWFLLRERMTRVRWFSFLLAIAGVLACSGVDWQALDLTSGQYLAGNVLIFASVLGSAFYNTYSKRLLVRYSELEVLLYSYYAVMAVLIPVTIASEPGTLQNIGSFGLKTWIGLAILAIFQYFLSMVIFLNVLSRLDATQAALPNYLIPFFGVLLAAIILGERLTWYMVLGGALVLVSTIIATVFDRASSES
jgi:drug/metabolite transporter (DMT)-like permease